MRNANDIQTIDSRTTLYYNSFLPSVIRDWNGLPHGNRNADSLNSFKRQIIMTEKIYQNIITQELDDTKLYTRVLGQAVGL